MPIQMIPARKKKAPPKNDLLDVVVLPFGALSGSKAAEAKDALERAKKRGK